MLEIEVIKKDDDGRRYYVLQHPFDVSLLDLEHIHRPFNDRTEAERAAETLLAAISGEGD